jgi:fructosamine-3-kinase
MTGLFGGFDPFFYSAYEANGSVAPGYRGRFPLYNLYHLLNHLNLFGSAYHSQVSSVLRRYL